MTLHKQQNAHNFSSDFKWTHEAITPGNDASESQDFLLSLGTSAPEQMQVKHTLTGFKQLPTPSDPDYAMFSSMEEEPPWLLLSIPSSPLHILFILFFTQSFTCAVLSHSVMSNSCDPIDCSLPGPSVHLILLAIILEWVAISSSSPTI